MKTVKHYLCSPEDWIQQVHEGIPSTLDGDILVFAPEIGEGTVQKVKVQEGLYITFIDIHLTTPLQLLRIADTENHWFLINFYFSTSEITQKIANTSSKLGFNNHSVLLSSAMTAAETVIPSGVPIRIFNITFSKEWLQTNVLQTAPKDSALQHLFSPYQSILLFENLDFRFSKTLRLIQSEHASMQPLSLFSNLLSVMAHFFEKIQQRPVPEAIQNISTLDLQNLLQVKQDIEKNWDTTPINEQLAQQAGMSLAKFKKLFKQVFGNSPYQYYLTYKMDKAMELLSKNEYTVSEVGNLVGYSNLSQFSKIFKRHHHILPKQVK